MNAEGEIRRPVIREQAAFRGWELLGLVLLAAVPYLRTLSFGFVQDDLLHVQGNPAAGSLSNAFSSFLDPIYPGNLYRPLLILSYGFTASVTGAGPEWYHAGNLLLHALVTLLLWQLLRVVVDARLALLTAGIFAVHPVHVEAVANVSGRSELLCHAFGLSALLVALRGLVRDTDARTTSARSYFAASILLLLALFTKESAVCYLPLFLLCGYWHIKGAGDRFASLFVAAAPFTAAITIYCLFRAVALGSLFGTVSETAWIDNPLLGLSAGSRTANSLILLGKYGSLAFAPAMLGLDYSYAQQLPYGTLDGVEPIALVYLLLCLVCLAIRGLGRFDQLGFFSMWFLLGFLATSNLFFPIGTIFGERLLYLPSAGIAGIVAWALCQVRSTVLRRGLVAAVFLVFAVHTHTMSGPWESPETLFRHQARHSPDSIKALTNYAVVLRNQGQTTDAQQYVKRAIELHPRYAEAIFVRATIHHTTGEGREAKRDLRRALEINPDLTPARIMLGRIAVNERNIALAERSFRYVLRRAPKDVSALLGMFAVALLARDLELAQEIEEQVTKLAPDNAELRMLRNQLERLRKNPSPGSFLRPA